MPDDDGIQLFCDESGITKDSNYVAIGFLSTNRASRKILLRIIADVRQEFNFKDEIHSHKMSKIRYEVYKTLIERTMPYVRFRVGIVTREDFRPEYFGNHAWMGLNYFTKVTLMHFAKEGWNAVLYLDFKTRELQDNGLVYLYREVNFHRPYSLKAVEGMNSKDSQLMQLSDLYLGLIRAGFEYGHPCKKGMQPYVEADSRKKQLYAEFINAFRQLSGKHQKIAVGLWEWKPRVLVTALNPIGRRKKMTAKQKRRARRERRSPKK